MSFEEFYETWWLDHENNVLAPTPKEAMRQAWLAGRKAEKAAQQSVQADECLCSSDKKHYFKFYTMGHVELCEWCGTRR